MDQLEEIKSKLDIVAFINERIPLKKAGRNYKARCPFHSEDTPSFMVSAERQIFKCFGCGEGGDIFGFTMKYENMEFGEALRFLADKAGVKLEREYQKEASSRKEILYKINYLAAEFFQYLLTKDKSGQQARQYLTKRNITSHSVKQFKLGYAPDSWEILGQFLQKRGYQLADILQTGLIVAKSQGRGYYDRFRGRLMFPVFDLQGNVVGFSGRIIIEKTEAPKYLNSPETPVYNKGRLLYGFFQGKEKIRQTKEIILTEGNIDIISAFQAGVENVVAPLGTALTESQVSLIKRFAEKVYLCFDTDIAGDKASRRGIELMEKQELDIQVVELKEGKDIDECLQKDRLCLEKGVKTAVSIYDFYLHSAMQRYNLEDPFAQNKMAQELLPVFGRIPNQIVRSHYLQKLAENLEINEAEIFQAAERFRRSEGTRGKSAPLVISAKGESRGMKLSKYLLLLILQKEDLSYKDLVAIEPDYFESKIVVQIVEKLRQYLQEEKQFLISEFYAKLEPEEVKLGDELLLQDLSYLTETEKEKEWESCILELQKIYLRKRLRQSTKKLQETEEIEGSTQILTINEEINQISQQIIKLNQGKKHENS